MINEDEQN